MNTNEWLVISGGLVTIVAIAYYFFGPKHEEDSVRIEEAIQTATVVVDGAYVPSQLRIKVGFETKIVFDRRDTGDCTEWVVFEDLPTKEGGEVKKRLPEGTKTSVSFTPNKPGEYRFICGMGMVHGKLIVEK